MLYYIISVCLFLNVLGCQADVSLTDDPSLFPGHLKPIGSERPQHGVKTLNDFPEPQGIFVIITLLVCMKI